MFCKVREAARVFIFALIILIIACTSTSNASSYTHTTYSDFIQGNGDGNIVFTDDGEIALSKQVGTAVGGFRLIGQLPFRLGEARITAARGCLYAVSLNGTSIYRAPILDDGSIGEWQATDLPSDRHFWGGLTVVDDYIHVWATGVVGDDFYALMSYAKLGTDGSIIGPWQDFEAGPPPSYQFPGPVRTARWGAGCVYLSTDQGTIVVDVSPTGGIAGINGTAPSFRNYPPAMNLMNGLLYVSNGTPLANVKYGLLDASGVPLWERIAFPLESSYRPYYAPSTIGVGGCLLGFGGRPTTGSFPVMNGIASVLDANGEPQARRSVAPLPSAFGYAGIASWGGCIYVAGGQPINNRWSGDIYAARIIEDGVPGTWTETSALPYTLTHHQVVAGNFNVYAIGGIANNVISSMVSYAPILGDGQLGDWRDATPLPEQCIHHAAVRHGDYIYVAGGITRENHTLSTVNRARILPDGSLGEWEPQTPLPQYAWGHGLLVYEGYIYCVYGSPTEKMAYGTESPVYSAQIMPDGVIGNWQRVSTLPEPLVRDASAILNGRLYVVGGQWYNKVAYSAPLTGNGGVGEWTRQPDLPYSIKGHGTLAFEGSLYVIGGDMALVTPYYTNNYPSLYDLPPGNVIYRATPDAAGNIGRWELLGPTPHYNEMRTGAAIVGDTVYFVGGGGQVSQPSNKAYYSRLHTPETELPTVSGGRYVGIFRLEGDEPMVSLHWSGDFGEGSGARVRYRTAAQDDTVFGPWSEFSAANPLPIGQTASCLQYEVQLESANGNPAAVDSIRLVTDTTPPTITIIPTPSVLWPANGKLVPVTINGSATDTESGVDHVEISISDEYGLPCEQVTDFGQTTHLEASRRGDDPDGRVYIVRVTAVDRAGNEAKAYALVVCPHDLGGIRKLPRRWQVPPTP